MNRALRVTYALFQLCAKTTLWLDLSPDAHAIKNNTKMLRSILWAEINQSKILNNQDKCLKIFVKDKFHHTTETKWSIKSLPAIDYVVVDLRADPRKPAVHFGRQYSRYHNPSWIIQTGRGCTGSEQLLFLFFSVYPFLSFIVPLLENNAWMTGGSVNKACRGDSLMVR